MVRLSLQLSWHVQLRWRLQMSWVWCINLCVHTGEWPLPIDIKWRTFELAMSEDNWQLRTWMCDRIQPCAWNPEVYAAWSALRYFANHTWVPKQWNYEPIVLLCNESSWQWLHTKDNWHISFCDKPQPSAYNTTLAKPSSKYENVPEWNAKSMCQDICVLWLAFHVCRNCNVRCYQW